jgi:hypothetical protein
MKFIHRVSQKETQHTIADNWHIENVNYASRCSRPRFKRTCVLGPKTSYTSQGISSIACQVIKLLTYQIQDVICNPTIWECSPPMALTHHKT